MKIQHLPSSSLPLSLLDVQEAQAPQQGLAILHHFAAGQAFHLFLVWFGLVQQLGVEIISQ
jgi:hypothetical protein